jgi:hypothetical protein
MNSTSISHLVAKPLSLTATIIALAFASTGLAGGPKPHPMPVQSHVFGKTYAEWSAAWWRWALSIPFDHHPLTDTADCSTGQKGHVWFLGGSFVSGTVDRECTVPAGKALFFPILNAECSTVEPPPFYGSNEAELRACAKSFVDPAVDLFAEIDGVPVQKLGQYRTQSPLFTFTAPEPNVLFVPGPVTGQSVSDGYYLLLPPLPVGKHTLHFGGTFPQFGPFTIDVTYHLTVVPSKK